MRGGSKAVWNFSENSIDLETCFVRERSIETTQRQSVVLVCANSRPLLYHYDICSATCISDDVWGKHHPCNYLLLLRRFHSNKLSPSKFCSNLWFGRIIFKQQLLREKDFSAILLQKVLRQSIDDHHWDVDQPTMEEIRPIKRPNLYLHQNPSKDNCRIFPSFCPQQIMTAE